MIEKKIYNGWAFDQNDREKAIINMGIYEELKSKYTILDSYGYPTKEQIENYDIVYFHKPCYLHSEYTLYKKPKEITDKELLLIFDGGNLCFGGSKMSAKQYRIEEDSND